MLTDVLMSDTEVAGERPKWRGRPTRTPFHTGLEADPPRVTPRCSEPAADGALVPGLDLYDLLEDDSHVVAA